MQLENFLISFRESILNQISGSRPSMYINNSKIGGSEFEMHDLGARLHQAIKNLLTSAMDEYGQVDYQELKNSSAYTEFKRLSGSLRNFDPLTLTTKDERLAFWINLYNTLILDAVINLEIRKSVTEKLAGIGFFRKAAYLVNGLRVSCDDIEHGILRANRGHPYFGSRQFRTDDPRSNWVIHPMDVRIHFVLNCASKSCPPIRVYSADRLDELLNMAASNFMTQNIEIDPHRNLIKISSIFKWFSKDFEGSKGVLAYILKYIVDGESKNWLKTEGQNARLIYKPYDWGLNGKNYYQKPDHQLC
jgi:hypothetical protein